MKSKVSIVRCVDYDQARVYEAVKKSIDLLGGIELFVKPGQKVLIKPNLLKVAQPEEAATTHPEFIRAVIRLVKQQTLNIYVGDSPAGFIKAEAVYEKCGIVKICQEENVTLITFDRIMHIEGMPFAEIMREVDVIISLPKFKTHNLTTITAAIKNVFGLIPGLYKVQCHKDAPNFKIFSALIAKIYQHARAHLSIVDSILAMEGDGPAAGTPREVGLVLASADAVAMDAVLAKIIGLNPSDIITTKEANSLKLGIADISHIDICGESIESVRITEFELARIVMLYKAPNFIARFFLKIVPLVMGIDYNLCIGCGLCKNSCPQQAIHQVRGKLKIDFRRCILCLCCSEVCPQRAIYMRFLKRRIRT